MSEQPEFRMIEGRRMSDSNKNNKIDNNNSNNNNKNSIHVYDAIPL